MNKRMAIIGLRPCLGEKVSLVCLRGNELYLRQASLGGD